MKLNSSIKVYGLASALLLCGYSCKEDKPVTSKPLEVAFKKEGHVKLLKNDSLVAALDIEIADNDFEIQTGLMYRSSMKNDRGMLFIFPNELERSFYMKNTRIPLDIIYFDKNNKLVSIQKNAKPFDETSLPSNGAAKYVLEVNGGLTDTWNLEVGDLLEFRKD